MPEIMDVELDGAPATFFTIRADSCVAVLTDVGARLLQLHVPNRDGHLEDVVLGRRNLGESLYDPHYMGSTVGRYANRIRRGRFVLANREFDVATNEGANHLHGGVRGFDRRIWSALVHEDEEAVTFTRMSPHGEEGFPGSLLTSATYRLQDTILSIAMTAHADQDTIVNLVHHSYFNLAGHSNGNVLQHTLEIDAEHYTPVDNELLPTGEITSVKNTPFDFRRARPLGERINTVVDSGAGRPSGGVSGYDHNWVLNGRGLRRVAVLAEPISGRRMEVSTNQPGIHLDAGGDLAGVTAKGGGVYDAFAGLAMETQTFPDAINVSHFPSPVLPEGERYLNQMALNFSTA